MRDGRKSERFLSSVSEALNWFGFRTQDYMLDVKWRPETVSELLIVQQTKIRHQNALNVFFLLCTFLGLFMVFENEALLHVGIECELEPKTEFFRKMIIEDFCLLYQGCATGLSLNI